MTRVASENSNELALFRHQAGLVRYVVAANADGLTHEESLVQPRPAGNCPNWVMGHLLQVYNEALGLLGQEPVMEAAALERYARGAPPIRDAAEAREFGELLGAWEEAVARIDAGLAELDPEMLDQPAPASPENNPEETIRTLLSTILFHQTYHAGQLGLLRRLVGREGAIR